jgi:hypothetical protein
MLIENRKVNYLLTYISIHYIILNIFNTANITKRLLFFLSFIHQAEKNYRFMN